jgi:CheY-like chemotaxis protein
MHVGIVEDNPGIAEMLATMLTLEQHSTERFENAQEAMRQVLDAQQNGRPSFDLMLVDLMLPGSIDGAEFISRVREMLPSTETRFILITGSGYGYEALERKHLLDIPLLSKPFKLPALLTLLGKTEPSYSDLQRSTKQEQEPAPPLPAQEIAGAAKTTTDEAQHVESKKALSAPLKQTGRQAPVAAAKKR